MNVCRLRRQPATVASVIVAALSAFAPACQPPPPAPPAPPPAATDPPAGCRADPFAGDVGRFFEAWGSPHDLTVAVFDDRTGCRYDLSGGRRVTTASVVKIEIMAGVLLRAQNAGRTLTPTEKALIAPMIRESANAPASSLWVSLGGAAGMDRVGRAFGLTDTVETSPTWGLTSTTAEDQARFVQRLVQGSGPLDAGRRGEAWRYLQDIRPDQRWGVRTGVPDGWTIGHKNGFAASRCCGWRVNSVGYVADPAGGGYAVAILSDRWRRLSDGIPLVDAVAATVARALTAPA